MNRLRSITQHYRTLYSALILGTVVTLVALLVLQGLPFFERAELYTYDFQFGRRSSSVRPNNIAIIGLDHTTIQDLNGGKQPIPRRYMANVVNFLHRSHARAIGLDFLFFYKSTKKDDHALAAAIKKAGNVVLGEGQQEAGASSNVVGTQLNQPIPQFANRAAGLGLANVFPDVDGTIRGAQLIQSGFAGERYPSFAAEVAAVALHQPISKVVKGLPNQMLINWVGAQNPGDQNFNDLPSFRDYQFEGLATGETSNTRLFRNKIVLVIPAAIEIHDVLDTPFGEMYGGTIQANILNTILKRDPIQPVGGTTNNIILLLLGLLTTLAAASLGIWRSIGTMLLLVVGYFGLSIVLFDAFRIWLNVITPETTVILVFAGIMALRFATEERQRRRTGKIFGQYVKPEIVDMLVNAPDEEKALAGARRSVSVLFVDVRGFTATAEKLEPEQVVRLLDIYLEALTASVQSFNGTLDKYVGDELMAIWNAPGYQEDHALLAVESALHMVQDTDRINQQLTEHGLPMIRYGIGINSGDAVVGQMGSSFRKQYDVVGDTINTASRLCSAAAGGEIIISEATWQLVGDRLDVEETEPLRFKGKSRPFRTFRVLSLRSHEHVVPEAVPASA